jgi:hypothetical protein
MADLDLDAIEARAKAATPGPWRIVRNGLGQSCGVVDADGRIVPRAHAGPWDPEGVTSPDDVFVAHAREDIPALIARVRELEHRVEQLTDYSVLSQDYDAKCARVAELEAMLTETSANMSKWSTRFTDLAAEHESLARGCVHTITLLGEELERIEKLEAEIRRRPKGECRGCGTTVEWKDWCSDECQREAWGNDANQSTQEKSE